MVSVCCGRKLITFHSNKSGEWQFCFMLCSNRNMVTVHAKILDVTTVKDNVNNSNGTLLDKLFRNEGLTFGQWQDPRGGPSAREQLP